MAATITSESSTSPVEFVMATVCKICAGSIEPLDLHLHCVACLGLALAHAEAAAGRVRLRTLRGPTSPRAPGPPQYGSRPIRGGAHCCQRANGGPPSPGGGSTVLPRRRTQRSPHSPVSFPEDCFRPPSNIEEFVSFGHEEGDDAMSISASEKED